MAGELTITLPDIGAFQDVPIIEVLVRPGQRVEAETPLLTLESDKATLDIPSPAAGRIGAVLVKVGDRVSAGAPLCVLEPAQAPSPAAPAGAGPAPLEEDRRAVTQAPSPAAPSGSARAADSVSAGRPGVEPAQPAGPASAAPDISPERPESSARPARPAPSALASPPTGAHGSAAEPRRAGPEPAAQRQAEPRERAQTPARAGSPAAPSAQREPDPRAPAFYRNRPPAAPTTAETVGASASARAHASPSVRRLARELGVDLGLVYGSGPKGRILREDVQAYTRAVLSGNKLAPGGAPAQPPVDFSRFGPVESVELSRIRRLSAQAVQRSWSTVPQVTQFDEADITDLEDFRHTRLEEAARRGIRLTLLAFVLKAVVVALRAFPDFCASLSPDGATLIRKRYYHLGVAVDTEQGLVVPVLRDVDGKGVLELAEEMQGLAARAREGRLAPADLQGGCFTVSSLGGIGGTGFTPIVNLPEVAILGLSRAALRPVLREGAFVPRLVLPYALSYDHRVVDGAAGARFTRCLSEVLSDIRQILL